MADTYFFFVLATALTEMVLSGFWNRFYFTIGIPVFRQRIPVRLTAELRGYRKSAVNQRLPLHRCELWAGSRGVAGRAG